MMKTNTAFKPIVGATQDKFSLVRPQNERVNTAVGQVKNPQIGSVQMSTSANVFVPSAGSNPFASKAGTSSAPFTANAFVPTNPSPVFVPTNVGQQMNQNSMPFQA